MENQVLDHPDIGWNSQKHIIIPHWHELAISWKTIQRNIYRKTIYLQQQMTQLLLLNDPIQGVPHMEHMEHSG